MDELGYPIGMQTFSNIIEEEYARIELGVVNLKSN